MSLNNKLKIIKEQEIFLEKLKENFPFIFT